MRNVGKLTIEARGDNEIVMTRDFDAPRELVFDALVKPELLKRWFLGPDGWSLAVCDIDLRVGGAYRYVWRNVDGREMAMNGVYREVVPPARLVHTEMFEEAWYPGEVIDTTELVERDGKTTMTLTMLCDSRLTRDGIIKTGMETGVERSYERLDGLLVSV
jgi:uncharacterized protein YndB with AHSA1/START domain